MIISHSGLASTLHVDVFINAFYMPMFFLISGYFLHVEKYSTKEYVNKKIKGLLVPYIIWGLFHFAVWMAMYTLKITELSETPKTMVIGLLWNNNVHLPIAGALWFISCLFIISIVSFLIIKSFGSKAYFLFSIVLGVFGLYIHPFIPWSSDTAMVANLFFAIGYWVALQKKKIAERKKPLWMIIITVLLSMVLFHLSANYNGFTNIRECNYGKALVLFLVVALIGIASWWLLSSLIYYSGILRTINRPIAWIGNYSMPFLCLNQLILAVLTRILPNNLIGQLIGTIVTLITIDVFVLCLQRVEKRYNKKLYSLLFGR